MLLPCDGHGAEDARVYIDPIKRTFVSEKWGGEAWWLVRVPRKMPGLHRWYLNHLGQLEYDIVLHERPRSNVFRWPMEAHPGLMFEFQPKLTPWEVRRGNRRPFNVVGSYSVYFNKRDNQYKTGKFCHVYRPCGTDANGRIAWGILRIRDGEMVIRWPKTWLANARYPIILDPSLGYSTLGASTDNTDDYSLMIDITASANGDANPGTGFYGCSCDSGTQTVYQATYTGGGASPSGKSLLAASSALTATTTMAFRSSSVTLTGITNGTHYWVGAWSNHAGVNSAYDAGSATGHYWLTSAGSPPSTYPSTLDNGAFNNRLSAYVDYTASGGSAFIKLQGSGGLAGPASVIIGPGGLAG